MKNNKTQNISNENSIIKKIGAPTYYLLVKKYKRSNFLFVFLNVLAMIIVSLLIIFNLYAIRWNGGKEKINDISDVQLRNLLKTTIPLFYTGVILNGASILLSTVIGFFGFQNKSKIIKEAISSIQNEHNEWQTKTGKYISKKRDSILIYNISKIVEKTT